MARVWTWGGAMVLGAALGVACGNKGGDTGDEPNTLPGDGGDPLPTCGGAPPEIASFSCRNTGVQPHYEEGTPVATFALDIEGTDADGDLDTYQLQFYIDDVIDGAVTTTESPFGPVQGTLNVRECEGFSADLSVTIYFDPDGAVFPAYNTTYEWVAVLRDRGGQEATSAVMVCTTPNEDGSDGDGSGA